MPDQHRRPDQIYDDALHLEVGGVVFELIYGRGESDGATFVWLPQQRVLASGDLVIWAFPDSGNPRKVQRCAPDWAQALRRLAAHLLELAPAAAPDDAAIQCARADVCAGCTAAETSLIGKAIYAVYQREAAARA